MECPRRFPIYDPVDWQMRAKPAGTFIRPADLTKRREPDDQIRFGSYGLSRREERRLHPGSCSKGMVMLTTPCVDFYSVCCFPHSVRSNRLSETKPSHFTLISIERKAQALHGGVVAARSPVSALCRENMFGWSTMALYYGELLSIT